MCIFFVGSILSSLYDISIKQRGEICKSQDFSFDFPSFEKTRTMLIGVDMYLLPKAIRRYESLRRLEMDRFLWNKLSVIKLSSVGLPSSWSCLRYVPATE